MWSGRGESQESQASKQSFIDHRESWGNCNNNIEINGVKIKCSIIDNIGY